MTSLKKVAILFRDHRLDQILNTLQFGYHAVRGFPAARLPYDPLWIIFNVTVRCNLRSPESGIGGDGIETALWYTECQS